MPPPHTAVLELFYIVIRLSVKSYFSENHAPKAIQYSESIGIPSQQNPVLVQSPTSQMPNKTNQNKFLNSLTSKQVEAN